MVQVSTLVSEALSRKSAGCSIVVTKKWLAFFVVLIGVLIHNIYNGSKSVLWQSCQCGLLFVIICITIKLFWRFLSYYFGVTPMEVTDKQRTLLSIAETDLGFKPVTPKKACSTPVQNKTAPLSSLFLASLRTPAVGPVTPMNMSAASWASPAPHQTPANNKLISAWTGMGMSVIGTPALALGMTPINVSAGSWANNSMPSSVGSSPDKSALNFSMNSSVGSVSANSWQFLPNQSGVDASFATQGSACQDILSRSLLSESALSSNSGTSVFTEGELRDYLKDYREKEKKRQIIAQAETNNSMNSTLWPYGASPHSHTAELNNLQKLVYQPALKDTDKEDSSNDIKNDEAKKSNLSSSSVSKIWAKRNVTQEELFKFTENLRVWMSDTLLVPLVKSIDDTNKALGTVAPEIQIGVNGIEKLKKTAQNISGTKLLGKIIPFLDVTVHQDYLVDRLRKLSNGGAISAFKWNGEGTTFNSKPWKEDYPTDTAILLHIFSVYMDYQLPPDILQPEGRRFSSTHIVKAPEKPNKPTSHPILYFSQINPPHLKVVLPLEEECDVGSGRNNFIHSLLLFIHTVVHEQHSHIGNINLNMSGVNLSWVVKL